MRHPFHPLLLLTLALLLPACSSTRDKRIALPADGAVPAQVLGTPRFAEPIFPADSPVIIIPFGVEVDAVKLKRHVATTRVETPGAGDTSRQMEIARAQMAPVAAGTQAGTAGGVEVSSAYAPPSTFPAYNWMTWNNVVLFNADTGESRLLLGRRAVITRFIYPQPAPKVWQDGEWVAAGASRSPYVPDAGPEWPRDLILLGVATRDTNRDGIIDADDAAAAYVASLTGGPESLTRVTPEGVAWLDMLHPADEPNIYLIAADDADRDGYFGGEADERYFYAVTQNAPFTSTPMTPTGLRRQAIEIVRTK